MHPQSRCKLAVFEIGDIVAKDDLRICTGQTLCLVSAIKAATPMPNDIEARQVLLSARARAHGAGACWLLSAPHFQERRGGGFDSCSSEFRLWCLPHPLPLALP
jgi:hypothetical protein